MNKAFLIACILGIGFGFSSYGQQSPFIYKQPKPFTDSATLRKNLAKIIEDNKKDKQFITRLNQLLAERLPAKDTARYSHTHPKGDVYMLPNSNMPMLKPFVDSMPFYNRLSLPPDTKIAFGSPIPNPLPTNPIYFEKPPTLQVQKSTDNTKK